MFEYLAMFHNLVNMIVSCLAAGIYFLEWLCEIHYLCINAILI